VVELVGAAEIAQMLGVSRQRVNEIARTDPEFPAPEAELAAGRIWSRQRIEAWMARRARPKLGVTVTEIRGVPVIHPREFGDAQVLADTYMGPTPVVLDLRRLDLMLERRFIDFSSGLAYGLKGSVDRLADHVLLLQPRNSSMSKDRRQAIADEL
jgi:cell division inhibitor SepF